LENRQRISESIWRGPITIEMYGKLVMVCNINEFEKLLAAVGIS
jgi:hypothetical protein